MPDHSQDSTQRAALEQVLRTNRASLLAYAVKLTLGDRQRAEDAVQEAMMRAWQHIDDIDLARDNGRPWLFTVLRRVLISQARSRAVRPVELHGEPMDWLPLADDETDRALDALHVRAVLAVLPQSHREVLIHLYLHERSTQETAELMGIPQGTVKSRAHNALRAVRQTVAHPRSMAGNRCQASSSYRTEVSDIAVTSPA